MVEQGVKQYIVTNVDLDLLLEQEKWLIISMTMLLTLSTPIYMYFLEIMQITYWNGHKNS